MLSRVEDEFSQSLDREWWMTGFWKGQFEPRKRFGSSVRTDGRNRMTRMHDSELPARLQEREEMVVPKKGNL